MVEQGVEMLGTARKSGVKRFVEKWKRFHRGGLFSTQGSGTDV